MKRRRREDGVVLMTKLQANEYNDEFNIEICLLSILGIFFLFNL